MATLPKKAATVKKYRTVSLVGHILTIKEGKGEKQKQTSFWLEEFPSDLGGRGLHLVKFLVDQRGEDDNDYWVHIGGEQECCDCRGFSSHGHCRHISALEALERAGRLPRFCPKCHGTGQPSTLHELDDGCSYCGGEGVVA